MRYYRQGYEIPIEVSLETLEAEGVALLDGCFNEIHEQLYGFRMEGTACEIVNLRVVGIGRVPEPQLAAAQEDAGPDAEAAVVDEHRVYFEGGWVPTRIYDRSKLRAGNRIPGPAVITEFDSTTVVLAGFTAEVDRFQNILINPNGEA
jgi:N-methylhydantoinase A